MKLRQKYAALIVAAIIGASVPTFAASTNGIDKVITVKEGSTIEASLAPTLRIELKDNLAKGQYFYLELENAQWESDVVRAMGIHPDFKYERESKTRLLVEAKKDILASKTAYRIPLIAKVTGGQAQVEIVSNETVVTAGKYIFAKSTDTKSIVTAESKVFASTGEMGKISIEEQYTGAFKSNEIQKVRVEIISGGIEFDYKTGSIINGALKGERAYPGQNFNAKVMNPTTLEVEIPANSLNGAQKGAVTFENLKIKTTKDAGFGDVRVMVSGDLNETAEVIPAKHGDYATELTAAKELEVTSGRDLTDVEFTLAELVPDSLNGKRETIFTFAEGITIEDLTVDKVVGAASPIIDITKKGGKNTNVFKIATITTDKDVNTAITFKATLKIPASFKGNLTLIAEGRSLEETKKVTVAKVNTPVEAKVIPLTAKIGYAQQEGATLLITEIAKGQILPGEIFLAFDHEDIQYTKAPQVEVIEGSINIEPKATIVEGGLEIVINSRSREAATIKLSGGEFKVNALISGGSYKVKVGGPALSAYSSNTLWDTVKAKHNDIDEITQQDFMYLGEKSASNKAEFIIGQTTYAVNGQGKTMDTVAYLSEGRTMLPVRYVADALGIPTNQIKWEDKEKAVTILVNKENILDKVIRIELGNKEMLINGATIPMTAATEMKNNRVFVPVAEIARALGADVDWNPATQMATFN